jgi:hypothetical protein
MKIASLLAFLTIVIGNSISAAGASPWSDRDFVRCGYRKHYNAASVTNETVDAWLKRYASTDWRLPMTPTTAHDAFDINLAASKNYLGYVGGGGGSRIVYDHRHKLIALCQVYDTADALFLFEHVPKPPFAVPDGELTGVATEHGIRLGSSLREVRHVYGPAPLVRLVDGHVGLAYQRMTGVAGIYTWFEITSGRVTSIQRLTGV